MDRRKFVKGSAIVGAGLAGNKLVTSNSGMVGLKSNREVYQILDAKRTTVGTLPILRAFAGDQQDFVSPFLLLDEFGPVSLNRGADPLRVDAHPHAGVIPTTYFIDGSGHHKDSLDFDFQIEKGEFMMFSSGRGAIHMEETGQKMFEEGGSYHGFQIWLNMPAQYKMIAPSTTVKREEDMGQIDGDTYKIKVVLGELFGEKSAIELLSPAFYYHIKLEENGRVEIPVEPDFNAFVYIVNGEVECTGQQIAKSNQIILYQRGKETINLFSKQGSEFLLLGGAPLNEKVYAYGPFVMNSEEQIQQCIKDYRSGKMGDPSKVN